MKTPEKLPHLIIAALIGAALLFVGTKALAPQTDRQFGGAAYFENEIGAFEEQDRTDPPPPGKVLFIGSSSIRLWKTLDRDMQPVEVLNRGFGGSMLHHSTYFADRIIAPYKPSALVIYAGDNDIGNRTVPRSAAQVAKDFDEFIAKVRSAVGDIPVVYIAIKPSISRAAQWPDMQRANAMIAERAKSDPKIYFADVASGMLDAQGKANGEMLVSDGLHMNAKGYALWTSVIRPILMDISKKP